MGVFNIIQGRTTNRNEVVDGSASLNSIGLAGATATIDMKTPAGQFTKIRFIKKAGPVSTYTFRIYDNPAQTEDYIVFEVEDVEKLTLDMNGEKNSFNNSVDNNLYVQIIPNSGSGHDFFIRIHAEANRRI